MTAATAICMAWTIASPATAAECTAGLIPDTAVLTDDLALNYAYAKYVLSESNTATKSSWDAAFAGNNISTTLGTKSAAAFANKIETDTHFALNKESTRRFLARNISGQAWSAYEACVLNNSATLAILPNELDTSGQSFRVKYLPGRGDKTTATLRATPESGAPVEMVINANDLVTVNLARPQGKDQRAKIELLRGGLLGKKVFYSTFYIWPFVPELTTVLKNETQHKIEDYLDRIGSGPGDGHNEGTINGVPQPGYVALPSKASASFTIASGYNSCIKYSATGATVESATFDRVVFKVQVTPSGDSCLAKIKYSLLWSEAQPVVVASDGNVPLTSARSPTTSSSADVAKGNTPS